MKDLGYKSQKGLSVIELLIVLAIAAVVVTFAVAQFGASAENLERQNVAKEFKVALERARFDSVKRRPQTCDDRSRVEVVSATSFRVLTDTNQDGLIDPTAESRTVDFANRGNIGIVGITTFPVIYRFDQRGNVSSGPCASETAPVATTTFCELPCGTPNATNANMIFLSTSGTTAMLRGGETIPTFNNPSVTNVNSDSQINPLLAVWDAPTGTPTPPSPDPSPTIDPGPSPTVPDPGPDPEPPTGPEPPTPTPTPVACTVGQRPAQDNCECRNPLTYHSPSGKCRNP